ncbi:Glycosyltransferase involved in cell wall bisynthesis [Bacillus sp. OV194]|nr:Glycosyltransferase involved in cell wall bisynthesis [Bacillus sp. OV194]
MKVLHFPNSLPMIIQCNALKQIGVDSTSVQFKTHSFRFKPDICLNMEKMPGSNVKNLMREFLEKAANEYDLFHFHDMPTGIPYTPTEKDLAVLKQTGKPLLIQHHGSEVRRLSIARNLGNPYVKVKPQWSNEKMLVNRLTQWGKIFDHAIIADHELFPYIEGFYNNIHVIRQPIDISNFSPIFPDPDTPIPLIVHAPSHREIKGTAFVLDAIKRLEAEGYKFNFKLVENMNHTTAKEVYQKADILIDQICIGGIGVLSLEGMALGKPVLCYIRDDLYEKYPREIPILNANPDTIYEKLKGLILNPASRRELGIKGREYAEKHHDSIKIAEQFKSLYEKLLKET